MPPGWLLERVGNGAPRGMIAGRETAPQNSAYRCLRRGRFCRVLPARRRISPHLPRSVAAPRGRRAYHRRMRWLALLGLGACGYHLYSPPVRAIPLEGPRTTGEGATAVRAGASANGVELA